MIGWLWRVVFGRFTSCKHEFEIYQSGNYKSSGKVIGVVYHLRCTKCGDMKQVDFL